MKFTPYLLRIYFQRQKNSEFLEVSSEQARVLSASEKDLLDYLLRFARFLAEGDPLFSIFKREASLRAERSFSFSFKPLLDFFAKGESI